MTGKQLNKAYHQPDHFWTGGKAIRERHKIASMSKIDFKP